MYHYADGDTSRGPVEKDALRGRITRETLVWRDGMPEWVPAGSLPELADLFAAAATPRAEPIAPRPEPVSSQQASFGPVNPPQPQYAPQPSYAQPQGDRPPLAPMHYQPAAPAYAQPPGTAIASMIMGILGLCFMCAWGTGTIFGILAIIFGYSARGSGAVGTNPGAAQATAGIVMGWISCALAIIGIIFLVILFIIGAAGAAASGSGHY